MREKGSERPSTSTKLPCSKGSVSACGGRGVLKCRGVEVVATVLSMTAGVVGA